MRGIQHIQDGMSCLSMARPKTLLTPVRQMMCVRPHLHTYTSVNMVIPHINNHSSLNPSEQRGTLYLVPVLQGSEVIVITICCLSVNSLGTTHTAWDMQLHPADQPPNWHQTSASYTQEKGQNECAVMTKWLQHRFKQSPWCFHAPGRMYPHTMRRWNTFAVREIAASEKAAVQTDPGWVNKRDRQLVT